MLDIKNTAIKMKNSSDGLISRLDMAEKRISELEDTSKTFQTEMERGKI